MSKEEDRALALAQVAEQAAQPRQVPDGYERIDGFERLVWLKGDGSFREVSIDEIRRLAASTSAWPASEETERRFAQVEKAFDVLASVEPIEIVARRAKPWKFDHILYVTCPKCHTDKPYGYRCGAPDCPQKAGAE